MNRPFGVRCLNSTLGPKSLYKMHPILNAFVVLNLLVFDTPPER